ncbi:hypothetical protein ACFSF0_10575 [Ottowia flava]|uniref:50S ribosomal protein L25 n=1 Tax=Ottowia flava TaxID=2675430 RepID=A0ABW4KUV5_9BURK|nr:hypothetical protein [Ottowia sp. GY511]
MSVINPNSLKVEHGYVEPNVANAQSDDRFEFERHGYFIVDRYDHVPRSRGCLTASRG